MTEGYAEAMWPCPTIRDLDATPASPYRAATPPTTTREKENTDDHQPR